MQITSFKDRKDAGEKLANKLQYLANQKNLIVLALPRGGVPIAFEVAKKLHCPLDVFLVRKIGAPQNEELAIGAIAPRGVLLLNNDLINYLNISPADFKAAIQKAQTELIFRNKLYRANKPPINFINSHIILIDDGMATGATMKVVISALKNEGASKITIAVPVSSKSALKEISQLVPDTVSLLTPENFGCVGEWYHEFSQVSHEEVKKLLEKSVVKP